MKENKAKDPPQDQVVEPADNFKETLSFCGRTIKIDVFLITIMINNFSMNACFSNILPFFPKEALSKGVPEYMVGIIFAALPFGGIICSFVLGKYISKIGRRQSLIFGILTNIFATMVMGCLKYIDNSVAFSIVSIASRLIQGVGRSAYLTGTFSSFTILYPSTLQKKIGYTESVSGLGMMLGPIIGSALYSLGGFPTPFFTFGVSFIIIYPITIRNLKKLNILEEKQAEKQRVLKIFDFFFDRRVISIFLAMILANINLTYLGPTLANHLTSFGVPTEYIGLVYPVATFAYIIAIKLVNSLPKHFERKIIIAFGLFVSIITQAMVGPQPFIFPRYLSIVICSQLCLGVSICCVFIPFIPEFKILGTSIYPDDPQSVADMASGFFNAGITLGGVLGSVLGGLFSDLFGFINTSLIFGIASLVVLVIYLSFGDGMIDSIKFMRRKVKNNLEKEPLLDKEPIEEINEKL